MDHCMYALYLAPAPQTHTHTHKMNLIFLSFIFMYMFLYHAGYQPIHEVSSFTVNC